MDIRKNSSRNFPGICYASLESDCWKCLCCGGKERESYCMLRNYDTIYKYMGSTSIEISKKVGIRKTFLDINMSSSIPLQQFYPKHPATLVDFGNALALLFIVVSTSSWDINNRTLKVAFHRHCVTELAWSYIGYSSIHYAHFLVQNSGPSPTCSTHIPAISLGQAPTGLPSSTRNMAPLSV